MGHKTARHAKFGPSVRTASSHVRVAHAYLHKSAFLNADPEVQAHAQSCLLDLHALLRALHWSYWNSHWSVKGMNSYSSHLLFERFYTGTLRDEIDGLAEKIVGYFGSEAMCPVASMQLAQNWLLRWGQVDCLHRRGLQAENDFQAAAKYVYENLKAQGFMPLGLDDFLMAIASDHEVNIYLLQQALGGRSKTAFGAGGVQVPPMRPRPHRGPTEADEPAAPSAEDFFPPNPRMEEVTEFAQTHAISNDPGVAAQAAPETKAPVYTEVAKAKKAPPTPDEIKKQPGGKEVSTLNRYVRQPPVE